NALDGFNDSVQDGKWAVLSHKDRINFLLGDGSVHPFNIKPLIFDSTEGSELLTEVSIRYGICFPTIMLHRWFEIGEVDLNEAKNYLDNPGAWIENNCTLQNDEQGRAASKQVLISRIGKRSLVSDTISVTGGIISRDDLPDPPPG
ncbi:MAG: hypothetical protein ACYSSI_07805, partial [Planctomycetota bacterium]